MLSPTLLSRLFSGLREHFDFSQIEEITFEANPATFTDRTANLYREFGITRVSLGIQSLHSTHLKTLGREHSVLQATRSVQLLQHAGPDEVNIDLIFSIPGQSLTDWESTLTQAIDLQPDHISAYNLTYEEDTAYFESFEKGHFKDDPELNAQMFSSAHDRLTAAGYEHYETSNYAKPGKRSRHNEGYWHGNDYLGLGPSAVSTIRRKRWQNVNDTTLYLKRVEAVGHALDSQEILDEEAWRLERLALMLRTSEGLPKQYLDPKLDLSPLSDYLELTDTHLRLIGEGPLLVDSIAAELC